MMNICGRLCVSSPNLELDLIKCDWIVAKAKADSNYAQSIYAALCNMQWQKNEVWPILKEEALWSCTWRYAGGIVAKILEEGDYMDWYCSGGEGDVTDEIAEDFLKLGWVPIEFEDDFV